MKTLGEMDLLLETAYLSGCIMPRSVLHRGQGNVTSGEEFSLLPTEGGAG